MNQNTEYNVDLDDELADDVGTPTADENEGSNELKTLRDTIKTLEERLIATEDALEDMTRAAEIVEITGQKELLASWIAQSNEFLKNRTVRPDSSVSAGEYKMTIINDDITNGANGKVDAT